MVAFCTVMLAGLSFSLLAVSASGASEQRGARESLDARYVCEAAMADATFSLSTGGDGNLGSPNNPVQYDGSRYWVTAAPLPNDLLQLTATGVSDRAGARLELTLQEVTSDLFHWGAFGDQDMHMDSNARVDSYDSSLGSYASQQVNGSGNAKYASANGDVGSNQNVLMEQNTVVWGDAIPGPGGTTTLLGSATVSGSTAPAASPQPMPSLTLPSIPSSGDLTVSAPLTLPPGDYRYESFVVSTGESVLIRGPARVVFEDFLMNSNSEFRVDATNGPVELWIEDDFEMDSNTLIASTTLKPADVRVYMLSDNVINPTTTINLSNVVFDSNAQLYGVLYAPSAAIEIDSNFELYGSLVAYSVDLDSNSRVHYDEDLANASISGEVSYQVFCWRSLPYEP